MRIKLLKKEYEELKQTHRGIKDAREKDKIKAIVMLSDGYTLREVSRVLFIDETTITRWKGDFIKRSTLIDWMQNDYSGYQGKLTDQEKQRIENYVAGNLISDSKEVIKFIKDMGNKSYSKSGVVELLHRLSFTYKKTKLIPSKYNHLEQEEFKKKYEELNKNLKEEEVILFGDAVHPQHNTTRAKVWIKIGKEKEIKSNTGRNRVNINGVYNPNNQDVIQGEYLTIDAEAMIALLKKVEEFYRDKTKIYIVLDNGKSNRNKKVTEYVKTSKKIEIIYLPVYSPNLNLIERLWKHMRKKVINNQYYEKFPDFKKALNGYFDNLVDHREEIRRFIGSKLHLFNSSSENIHSIL